MAMVQHVTSLGHAARQNANLKVRQPLAQVVVRTAPARLKRRRCATCSNWCSTS